MSQRYNVPVLQELGSLNITRVQNGWLVHINPNEFGFRGEIVPMRVAETPETLHKIIEEWIKKHCEYLEERDTALRGE